MGFERTFFSSKSEKGYFFVMKYQKYSSCQIYYFISSAGGRGMSYNTLLAHACKLVPKSKKKIMISFMVLLQAILTKI